jgi:hypothetical protein
MSTPTYDEIRQQVERRYRRRSLLVYHIIIAFVCLTVIWFTASHVSMLPEAITTFWIGLLLIHGVRVFMSERSERAIERMWQRYYGDLPYEKPKRDVLHLTDDGELEVIEEATRDHKVLRG